mgnify:FL=1
MAFTIDVKAALVFVVTIPLLSVVVFGIMLVSIPLYKKVQAALDKVLGITRENLTGSRVIRAFNKEQDEIAQFHEDNEALTKIQLYVGKISALMNPLTYIIINGAIVGSGMGRSDPRGQWQHYAGTGCGAGELHVPDLSGVNQAGQPDYQHQQIHCLHEPYRDCA